MFTKTAKQYDAVYAYKDYQAESELITELIRDRVPNAKSLLDVACGTGKHLEHLSKSFETQGVDLDPEMLAIARERVPEIPLHTGDMCEFKLSDKFDAVTCIFSSIGYTKSTDRLNLAIANMAQHLNPGGILFVEAWITPEDWLVGRVRADTYETDDGFIQRMAVMEPIERGRLVLEYMIGDSSGISRVTETHELGWFTHEEYSQSIENAGLNLEHLGDGLTGRSVYIGTKP